MFIVGFTNIQLQFFNFNCKSYSSCLFALYCITFNETVLLRPPGLATDRISRLSWPNIISFAANYRWTCGWIIDIAINLFPSEDQYFLWITAVPLFTIPTTFENAHARCYTHEAPLTQSVTQVGSSLLDSSMLWLFRKAITSPIIVSTSSPTCFTGTNSIAIDLITVKNQFFSQHRPPATICHFFLLWWGDCNDFSITPAPENMSHENIHYYLFLHLDVIWAYHCNN